MADSLERLFGPVRVPDSIGGIYTVTGLDDGGRCVLQNIIVANTTASSCWLTLSLDETTPEDFAFFFQVPIAAHRTENIPLGLVLYDADQLFAEAQTADSLTITGNGVIDNPD